MVYYVDMADSTTIEIKRNNDRNYLTTVKKDNVAVDITGWSIRMTVKKNQNDSDDDAIIDSLATITDADEGEATIAILASDTADKEVGPYYYDVLAVDDQGKRQSSRTGIFDLQQEITDGS